MPDVTTAPSAEQTPAAPSPAPHSQETLNSLSPEQRTEWRKTGTLPSKEAPATSKEDSAAKPAETAPVSETGPQEKPKRDNAETRLKEILADLKTAGFTPAELKTFKREAKQAETKAESSPAPVKVEAPKNEAPVKPKWEDFKELDDGWVKYEAAKDKWVEDFTEYKRKEAIADFQKQTQEEYQRQKLSQELSQGRTKYQNYDQITTPVIQALQADGMSKEITEVIGRSPVFVDLLYVIGENEAGRDEFLALAKSDPWAAVRKAVIMEQLITEELAKSRDGKKAEDTPRDDKGKFLSSTPEKKVTSAPKPPSEVGGTAAAPGDVVEEAVKKSDFSKYRMEMNRREIAARKSG